MTLPVLFGANVDPVWQPLDGPLERTRHAERLGLDFVTVQDHPYQPAFHDTWTLLTFLAAILGTLAAGIWLTTYKRREPVAA